MEALTAAAVAALTLYDMAKALQRDIVIESVELLAKEGGRSGCWERGMGKASEGTGPRRCRAAPCRRRTRSRW